ncbi:MAG: hypothetical protein U9Q79_06150, partial [Candidatus Hydrogenedentes bacterium]|nr:hypothetical protein [Candidatus Hydrogenedentota bacterium]
MPSTFPVVGTVTRCTFSMRVVVPGSDDDVLKGLAGIDVVGLSGDDAAERYGDAQSFDIAPFFHI